MGPWWPGGVARKVGGELGESGALMRAPAHLPASPGFQTSGTSFPSQRPRTEAGLGLPLHLPRGCRMGLK